MTIPRAFLVLTILVSCASSSHPTAHAGNDGGDASSSSGGDSAAVQPADVTTEPPVVTRPSDHCIAAGNCAPGTWIDVTPVAINLTDGGACGNFGTKAVQVDPMVASDVYTSFNCQGIWKSTDYGQTWSGPINTGTGGEMVGDCAAAIAIARASAESGPILYESCIRGDGIGFWRSTNGGVDWKNLSVLPDGGQATAINQQFYAPAVDPYDANHLIMAAHEVDLLVESTDGGQTWTNVPLAGAMITGDGGTGGINFVNTGVASTTRTTWLWLAATIGVNSMNVGTVGTWRTSDGGATWTNVDENEHTNGSMHSEVYQPTPYSSGVIYMAGGYSALGSGVLRSSDYGQTWTHVGLATQEAVVVGTPSHVYAMYGWAAGEGATVDPTLEVGPTSSTGTWAAPGTPAAMTQGPGQAAVTNDGTHDIIIVANYNAGLWRYIEP
jgi:hypothetical protein